MTEETLENLILGHIAKELKDEIQIGRQVNLAKTIMQALRIYADVGRSEQLKAFADWLQSDTANLNYDFRDLVDEYLKSL